MDHQDPHSQQEHHAELDERAQVVARREQQPDGQSAGEEAITNERHREGHGREREPRGECRGASNALPAKDARDDEHESNHRDFEHLARAPEPQIQPHEHRYRYRRSNREGPPRASAQSVDDDKGDDGKQKDHDEQHGKERCKPADVADLLSRHLTKRFAVSPHRPKQNDEILHAAAKNSADDDPERAWQISELCGERRTNERSGARNGGEVMAEDDPFVRGFEVATVP